MNRIHLLEKSVAERIAAGEVVERPASAVKELLENAIAAGATAVTLEIRNGGVSFIRVTDNGSGILREDLPAAFQRHATSKVRTADDLEAIGTLGFRGEALASIAAVARVELMTRTEGEVSGSRIELEGGEITAREDAGCPRGTTVIVRDLFFNTPARMKFLKKDVSEGNAVTAVAERIALSHPEVSLRYLRDGKEEMHTPGDSRLISAVHAVLGRDFARELIPADYSLGGVEISGFVTKPVGARRSRNYQFFFINGRLVKSRTAMAALDEAYRGSVMAGKFPGCVLHLKLNPTLVDVNVHPAKIEVRFADERQIFNAVYYAAKNALAQLDTPADFHLPQPERRKPAFAAGAPAPQTRIDLSGVVKAQGPDRPAMLADPTRVVYTPSAPAPHPAATSDSTDSAPAVENSRPDAGAPVQPPAAISSAESFPAEPISAEPASAEPVSREPSSAEPASAEGSFAGDYLAAEASGAPHYAAPGIVAAKHPSPAAHAPEFRVAGQCFDTYILVESGDELLLIDKHAAHERIIYEELKAGVSTVSQQLLRPEPVTLTREEHRAAVENLALLHKAGFAAEDFGSPVLLVRAAPSYLQPGEIAATVAEMADQLLAHRKDVAPVRLDELYHSVACRAAIKGGDRTGAAEAAQLVRRVLGYADIRTCPHGRPVVMAISRVTIEKQFGRRV